MNAFELIKKYKHGDIYLANQLVQDMQREVAKYTKLLELAQQDQVNVIRNEISWHQYIYLCPKAQKWLSKIESEKIDKRKRYEEKDYFELLKKDIENDFIGKPIEITKIISFGWTSSAYEIYFKCDDKDFMIEIPDTSQMNIKNFDSMHEGKICIFLSYDHVNECIASSYDTEELKASFQEHLNRSGS